MKTKEYARYAKYTAVAGLAMFAVGAFGEITGRFVLTDLPPSADSAFVSLLGLGLVALVASLIAGGVLPLALE